MVRWGGAKNKGGGNGRNKFRHLYRGRPKSCAHVTLSPLNCYTKKKKVSVYMYAYLYVRVCVSACVGVYVHGRVWVCV